jgi:PAS domain S-box-containing protein
LGGDWVGNGRPAESGFKGPTETGFEIERDLLCTSDATGCFQTLNAAWEDVLGWTRDELMARPWIDLVHPEDVAGTLAESAKVIEPDSHVVNFENRWRTKGGEYRWLRWSARSDGETWFAVAFDVTERKQAEQRLRRALAEDRLIAYAQPIAEASGRVTQEELLVRMLADEGVEGVLEPRDFLPLAERSGLIVAIDRWMAGRAIELATSGRPAELNLSAVSICDDELPADLATALEKVGAGAANVVFEITETAAIEHIDAAREFVERLSRLGCRFALDDFGTGFGSLTYLRHLPVQYLKIDAGFVRGLVASPEDQRMVQSIVGMAGQFGLRTVAEGVEDAQTLAMVREFGVDLAQGFGIGRPRPLRSRTEDMGAAVL